MKAITLIEPWASAIAEGRKTIETRGRRTGYRGRLAIHAGKTIDQYVLAEWRERGLLTGPVHPGMIVASAVLTCVPMVHTTQPRDGNCLVVASHRLMLHGAPTEPGSDVTDQRPFGYFSPGRWALLLDDIAPTTERCPWCWGTGWRCDCHQVGDCAECNAHDCSQTGCPICTPPSGCGGSGRCDPIPARGQQAIPWEWTP